MGAEAGPTLRFVVVALDHQRASALATARAEILRACPSLDLRVHVAADWSRDPDALDRCLRDLRRAHMILVAQLFLEEHVEAIRPTLEARADRCDAVCAVLCAPALMRTNRLGRFRSGGESGGAAGRALSGLVRKLRGASGAGAGERQMRWLRRAPRLLKRVPGRAQDLRTYLLAIQYWLAGSPENLAGLVRTLVGRYAAGPRAALAGLSAPEEPIAYPETGLYHPDLGPAAVRDPAALPRLAEPRGRVGLLLMRSYVLAGDTAHYDAVIRALEARGIETIPAFAAGLDQREAVARYHADARIDALVSLTGFSLVGGPAYRDADAALELLGGLDVPYLCLQPLEFQSRAEWAADPRGLDPLQSTLMVAIPELDGATSPIVFSGRDPETSPVATQQPIEDRVALLADRLERLIALRRTPAAERRLAIALFAFPPNSGTAGTAAHLSVFESVHRLLVRLEREGYDVEVPADVEALERSLLGDAPSADRPGRVLERIPVDDHVRREPWLREIETQWGPAPGHSFADGGSLVVYGARFGNVAVVFQPPFGYEGDPMRLLFEGEFAPTHAFSSFYRWIRDDFAAHACLHFGTHGATEFMPGKQVGLGSACWPDRLVGGLPCFYLYAANNPSEGALARRRMGATLVSYLTPPVRHAGLYRGLLELKSSLDAWSRLAPGASADERERLLETLDAQALSVDLPGRDGRDPDAWCPALREALLEVEYALIPQGLHVLGRAPDRLGRADLLAAIAEAEAPAEDVPGREALFEGLDLDIEIQRARLREAADHISGGDPARAARHLTTEGVEPGPAERLVAHLARIDAALADNRELDAIAHALGGRWVAPTPGGDLLRNPDILPTGRNIYAFDPFRMPSTLAVATGRREAERLLARHARETGAAPERLAMVLWGTDNLKTDGVALSTALALMGVEPRFDGYGRLAGARLLPLERLGRPRVDVVMSLSGIFRDLMPLQVRLLAEAAWLAASADEPLESNPIRRHALALVESDGLDLERAALRVFSNDEGAYGARVNQLVESGTWEADAQLADAFAGRKGYAYGRDGRSSSARELFERTLSGVDLTYQCLDSVELGLFDVDQYFDALGGLTRVAASRRDGGVPTYVGDLTSGEGTVRTLGEQIALESRTRTLNPRWYEPMLAHGFEGVREIDSRLVAALGWSATTGEVPEWVYRGIGETFVLDDAMRRRLADLNPTAAHRIADRLLEASDRGFWEPDDEMLEALGDASDELEDRLEGIVPGEEAA